MTPDDSNTSLSFCFKNKKKKNTGTFLLFNSYRMILDTFYQTMLCFQKALPVYIVSRYIKNGQDFLDIQYLLQKDSHIINSHVITLSGRLNDVVCVCVLMSKLARAHFWWNYGKDANKGVWSGLGLGPLFFPA